MLKKFGYGLIAVSALMFSAGVVNNSFISSVMAEEKEKDKEGKSGELMSGAVKTAFSGSIMSDDKSEDKDKEGKSGKLMTGTIKIAFAGSIMSEDESKDKDKDKEGKLGELI